MSFKVTNSKIEKAFENACKVLGSVSKEFVVPTIVSVRISNACSYWGRIGRVRGTNAFKLSISREFERIVDVDLAQRRLEECLIHELIHTMPGRMNHGPKFKQICYLVNNKYSGKYNIQTRTSYEDYGEFIKREETKPKYEIVCPHCNRTYYYKRLPKYDISRYNCACGKDGLTIKNIR